VHPPFSLGSRDGTIGRWLPQHFLIKALAAALGRSLKTEHRQLYKRIEKLLILRNRIAHKGEAPTESEESRDVVAAADEVFLWLKELPAGVML